MPASRSLVASLVFILVQALAASPALATCSGDCDGDGHVASTELDSATAVLMGRAPAAECGLGDANRDGLLTVSELLPGLALEDLPCPVLLGIVGQVLDVDTGAAIAGADVALATGERGTADISGFFSFPELASGDVLVQVSAAGYAAGARTATPSAGGGDAVIIELKRLAEAESVDPAIGGKVGDPASATVDFPPQAFSMPGGGTPEEPVEVVITKIDPEGDDAAAAPGSFSDVEGSAAMDSLGAAEVSLMAGGEEIVLAQGKVATVTMPVPASQAASMTAGEEIPSWSFDATSGKWTADPAPAVVEEDPPGSGQLVLKAPVTHFSWRSFGRSFPSITCAAITLVSAGIPVAGVQVRALGAGFGWTTAATTDAQGRACLPLLAGRQHRLRVRLGGVTFHELGTIMAPSGFAACALGGCEEIGPFEVPFTSCVTGRVLTSTGLPMPFVRVFVVPGETVQADASGLFCSRAPAGRTVSVTSRGHAGISVRTPDSAACGGAGGACARADLRTETGAGPVPMGKVEAGWRRHHHQAVPGSPNILVLESPQLSANFSIAHDPPPGATITLDSDLVVAGCRVTERVWEKVYVGQSNVFEPFSGVVFDPGNPGELVALPADVRLALERGNPFWNAPEVDWFLQGWFTYTTNEGLDAFTDDIDVAVSFPGGRDVGAFAATQHVPERVAVLEPDLMGVDPVIPRNAAMTVRWTPAARPTVAIPVVVELQRGGTQQTLTPEGWGRARVDALTVQCSSPDDGELVVPAEITALFPGGARFVVRRTQVQRIPVRDRRTNRPASVVYESTSSASRDLPSRLVGP